MREPLVDIDLNIELSEADTNNGNWQQDQEARINLPDLNIAAPEFVNEYNLNLNSSTTEVFHVDDFPQGLDDVPSVETFEEDRLNTVDENINDENEESSHPPIGHTRNWKNLSNDKRRAIYNILLQKSINGKLKRGVTKMVALQFSVSLRTVQRIWKQSDKGRNNDVSHRRVSNCGQKRIQIDCDQIRGVPLHRRTTLESLARYLNTSKSTLFRRLKSGDIRRHSNAIKPYLKEENKRSRLQFCLSMLEGDYTQHDPLFSGMYNIIHIDEKWFNLTKKSEHYYLLPDEEDPHRTCKSKNFIAKVMFLVAIARPRFDEQGNVLFSGKIGVFPFVTQEPARRTSVNRVAGTMETKPITSVNRDVIRSYLIDKVIPAIKEKWPREDSRYPIFIQQDNARSHISQNDDEFLRAAVQDGFDIRLMCQPPNSPDLNVLDLGFFAAIQSLQYKEAPKNIDELVNAVVHAFEFFSTAKSNQIMRAKGSNKYKIPHINKAMLEREGRLPVQMRCDRELVQEVLSFLG
ncbi:hypothetical protein ABFS83_02G136600 [Erythranthe nasuta]